MTALINWFLRLFQKDETSKFDEAIKEAREELKGIDKDKKPDYTTGEEALKEWKD